MVNDTTNQAAADDKTPSAEPATSNPVAALGDAGPVKTPGNHSAGPQAKSAAAAPSAKAPKRRFIKVFFLLLLLAVATVAAYLGWRQLGGGLGQPFGAALTGQSANPPVVDTSTPPRASPVASELSDSVETLNARSERQEAELRKLENLLAEMQLQSQSQQQRIQEMTATTREDWLLAEAEYLLRLANQRILTEKQGANALSLMESVDAMLKELDDPDLFAVRKALAADITQLRLAGEVDREGIYLQLSALIGVIPQLDIPMVTVAEDRPEPAAGQPWYATLAGNAWRALKKLSGIIRVERVDEIAAPRLLPSQQDLLRLNLRLALEQAQLGLLREEPEIYRASLHSAEEIIKARFTGDKDATVVLAQLTELAAKPVVQDLPSASASIKALQDYIALWHNRFPVEAEPDVELAPLTPELPTPVSPAEGEQP